MGWGSGSSLMIDIIKVLKEETVFDQRKRIYIGIIEAMERHDWDTQGECMDRDGAFDAALRELHPDWFADTLPPCPFCGGQPDMYGRNVDAGSGDYQFVYSITCGCPVGPAVRVRGQHGYRRTDDLSNEEAEALAREQWSKRS